MTFLPFDNDTACAVCGEGGDEDLILLCDAENCGNEVHMYCLNPVITQIPEGEWFCPVCDQECGVQSLSGLLLALSKRISFFGSHLRSHASMLLLDTNLKSSIYEEYQLFKSSMIQRSLIPFTVWESNRIPLLTSTFTPFQSEFDSSSKSLIGKLVRIFNHDSHKNFVDYHTGRIIGSRTSCEYHRQALSINDDSNCRSCSNNCPFHQRQEHLIYFKRYEIALISF